MYIFNICVAMGAMIRIMLREAEVLDAIEIGNNWTGTGIKIICKIKMKRKKHKNSVKNRNKAKELDLNTFEVHIINK